MSETKLNLFEKIQSVSNEVRNLSKGMTVGSGSYSYKAVSDIDVTLAVKDAETKFKITSIPIIQKLINSEVLKSVDTAGKEKVVFVDNIEMTVRFIDLEQPSDFIDVISFGKGIDSGDKGFGKASTYARKYALLNAYKIATGEDPDVERSKEYKTKVTYAKLKEVYDEKKDKIESKHFEGIKTIVENKKVADYERTLTYLKSL